MVTTKFLKPNEIQNPLNIPFDFAFYLAEDFINLAKGDLVFCRKQESYDKNNIVAMGRNIGDDSFVVECFCRHLDAIPDFGEVLGRVVMIITQKNH